MRAYEASRQILRLAGLSLVEASSGVHKGRERSSKRGRPVLRRHAYIFALRCVRKGGLFREEFDAMVQRNGGVKIKALAALSRQVLKILYTVARERRPFVPVHTPAGLPAAAPATAPAGGLPDAPPRAGGGRRARR